MKRKKQRTETLFFILTIILMATVQSCAPVFSELQSARTVGKNRVELTPFYSDVNWKEGGESFDAQQNYGLQVAYGITDKIDLRLGYVYINSEAISNDFNVIGIGPKFGIVDDILSISLPIGREIGEDGEESWQWHPTLLVTAPIVKDKFEITFAPKYLMTFCSGCDDMYALNIGLSLGELNKWALRLEYGRLFFTEFEETFRHFSIGFSVTFGK